MRRPLALVTLAVLVGLAGGLVAHFPAARAIDIAGLPPPLAVERIDGTVWQGRAYEVAFGAPIALTSIEWRVSPGSLLRGRLEIDSAFTAAGGSGNATIAVLPDGSIDLGDAIFRGPMARLSRPFPLVGVSLDGSVIGHLAEGRLVNGRPVGVQGRALWDDAVIRGATDLGLGTVTADFAPGSESDYAIEVSARGGAVTAEGRIRLDLNGRYELVLHMQPQEHLDPAIRDLLQMIATPEGERYVIRDAGMLAAGL